MRKMINAVSFLAMLKEKCYYVSAFGENAELGIKYQSKFVLEKVLKDNGVQVGYAVFDNTDLD